MIEYPHGDLGFSVIGGYVYRGSQFPQLYGRYIFGDFVSGRIWAWDGVSAEPTQIATASYVNSFGEDGEGELYIVRRTSPGEIDRLEESDSLDPKLPQQLSQTGLFSDTASLTPAEGMIEYEVNSPLWSDGAIKRRWLALPMGQRIEFDTTEAWRFPVGTAFVKHFELFVSPTATRRLETRVFLRQREGWIGFTYRWNEDETDADLLTERLSEDFQVDLGAGVQTQTWTYPSPNECMGCHTAAAGYVLGARTRQLNRIFGDENQLHAWNCMGVFEEEIGDPSALGSYANPADPTASLQQRARAYLAANCAICHQPLGPAPGGMDMRYAALLGDMNLIGVSPSEGDLGLPDPRRIKPGRSIESVLWQRLATTDPDVRMARGTLVPDTVGIQILAAWIDTGLFALDSDGDGISDEIDNCPRVSNALQRDTGGLDTLIPDGVGDACQCGDTDESGRVDQADVDTVRWGLADPITPLTEAGQRREKQRDEADGPHLLPPQPRPRCIVGERLREVRIGGNRLLVFVELRERECHTSERTGRHPQRQAPGLQRVLPTRGIHRDPAQLRPGRVVDRPDVLVQHDPGLDPFVHHADHAGVVHRIPECRNLAKPADENDLVSLVHDLQAAAVLDENLAHIAVGFAHHDDCEVLAVGELNADLGSADADGAGGRLDRHRRIL
ncbi:MAG: thrombospondin type 3 repeat-containing protein, partial [Gemmatimonadetes bacterium]|nr:thrombospondin type 3 repeat-containing protein [Gemmatimonadota bacterium]